MAICIGFYLHQKTNGREQDAAGMGNRVRLQWGDVIPMFNLHIEYKLVSGGKSVSSAARNVSLDFRL